MENQHRMIAGYRELNEREIEHVNKIKQLAELVGELVIDLLAEIHENDKRWIAIGQTQLQQGFMALTRAVTKPTTF